MKQRLRRLRLAVATVLGDAAGWSSRRLGRGSGEVIAGRVIQTIAPDALAQRLDGRPIAIVSGTNGKSTTTALLAAAVRTRGPVATNDKGANMPAGIVTALGHAAPGATAVLEVDEGYVPALLSAAAIDVLVLVEPVARSTRSGRGGTQDRRTVAAGDRGVAGHDGRRQRR